jgi:hypothetical protein
MRCSRCLCPKNTEHEGWYCLCPILATQARSSGNPLSPISAKMEKCEQIIVMLHTGDRIELRTGRTEGSYFELGHGVLRVFTTGKHLQIIR